MKQDSHKPPRFVSTVAGSYAGLLQREQGCNLTVEAKSITSCSVVVLHVFCGFLRYATPPPLNWTLICRG